MLTYEERLARATSIYEEGLLRVKRTPEPEGQKYHVGARVKIQDDLPPYMSHFPSGKMATVSYTYAHAYGGSDIKDYSLNIDGIGEVAWYDEDQLQEIKI
jgi:hypothetical protein